MKKHPAVDLDDVVRQYADGHYVQQSMPGPNPERDKKVSDAIAKLKKRNVRLLGFANKKRRAFLLVKTGLVPPKHKITLLVKDAEPCVRYISPSRQHIAMYSVFRIQPAHVPSHKHIVFGVSHTS
ncbi:hypothetical protein ACFSQ7_03700 [Paenibacillus rhizoplanae]